MTLATVALDFDVARVLHSQPYREAYGRINGLVVVGEGLADRHFRLLAAMLPDDAGELLRLGAMEGRHARDFVGCGRHLGVRADGALARRLLAPLHEQFLAAGERADLVSCLVIQCLIIECFAVAAYHCYLPVADAYARPITAAVMADEQEHLAYGELWLRSRLEVVKPALEACCRQCVPLALQMLKRLQQDLATIGIDPAELIAEFASGFEASLRAIGYEPLPARRLLLRCLR